MWCQFSYRDCKLVFFLIIWLCVNPFTLYRRKVWRYQKGNQKLYIEKKDRQYILHNNIIHFFFILPYEFI